jgi:hypothetical protein
MRNDDVPLASTVMAGMMRNPYDWMTMSLAFAVQCPLLVCPRVQKAALGKDPHCIEVPSFERP